MWDFVWKVFNLESGWKTETGTDQETGIVYSQTFSELHNSKLFRLEVMFSELHISKLFRIEVMFSELHISKLFRLEVMFSELHGSKLFRLEVTFSDYTTLNCLD